MSDFIPHVVPPEEMHSNHQQIAKPLSLASHNEIAAFRKHAIKAHHQPLLTPPERPVRHHGMRQMCFIALLCIAIGYEQQAVYSSVQYG